MQPQPDLSDKVEDLMEDTTKRYKKMVEEIMVVGNVRNYPSVSTLDCGAGMHFRVKLDHLPGLIGLSQHL